MPATADFLVEIGTEELPPKALRSLEQAFAEGVREGLKAAGLGGEAGQSFATPRRLAVLVPGVRIEQPAQRLEKRGPPLKVAFDASGAPTRAALAFAESCGVDVGMLDKLETGTGAWLMFRGEIPGKPATALLPAIVTDALAALPVPRRMRWGNRDLEFVRPAHWLVMMLGHEVVPGSALGLPAGNRTRGHRFMCPGELTLQAAADYERTLKDAGSVLPAFAERRERVRALVVAAGRELGGEAVVTEAVLDEVTALVEWPVTVCGRFDAAYLRLPEEVLTATLQGHQRYFPVRGGDGKLLAHFVAISNLRSRDPEQVQRGNERVVKPRLADAAFFWDKDLGQPLAGREPALADIVFQRGLGSLREKSARVAAIAASLAPALGADPATVRRAALLAKTDLLTDLVREFPELQGRMGYHYALLGGEGDSVATAIEEQYLPRHAGDRLAGSAAGRCLAVADRLDTLAGVFALGKRPSGTRDPFGLRRAALGVVRTLIEGSIDLALPEALGTAVSLQPPNIPDRAALVAELYEFIIERLRAWYLDGQAPGLAAGEVTAEMFEAVRSRAPASPLDFHARILAVRSFMWMAEAQGLAVANKRIANILKGIDDAVPEKVDPALFEAGEERRLHEMVDGLLPLHRSALAGRRYSDALRQLARLRDPVDAFFTAVMVMTEDATRRRNRLAQLQRLRELFLDVADLSCLPAP
jgi:glycyl-tRNA synthetase beta chain